MSFFNGIRGECTPGRITGNPLNGLCEKVCIDVRKVFDACIRQVQQDDIIITLNNYNPPNPVFPLTFVSGRSSTNKGVITNLTVERLIDRPRFARVKCVVNIPIEIVYVDADGVEGTATGIMGITQDVILAVPQQTIMPYEIVAIVSSICPDGRQVADGQMSVDACITIIMKIIVEAEILVPSYGFCAIPPCEEYTENICSTFFELPLYPGSD